MKGTDSKPCTSASHHYPFHSCSSHVYSYLVSIDAPCHCWKCAQMQGMPQEPDLYKQPLPLSASRDSSCACDCDGVQECVAA